MSHPAGESKAGSVQLRFDRRLKLEFHGSNITSDAGLLAYRGLDEVLGLTTSAGTALSDLRRGRNRRHFLTGLLRQSIFGRLNYRKIAPELIAGGHGSKISTLETGHLGYVGLT